MSKINAFPFVSKKRLTGGQVIETEHQGMNLRDYFAAKAMQSFISTNTDATRTLQEAPDGSMIDIITEASYKIADAMLKERSKS